MKMQVSGKGGTLRRAARAAWVAPVAAAGFAFAVQAPGAAGDVTVPSVSVPTVSVPTVTVPTVTLPQILPTTSTVTSDPPPTTGALPSGTAAGAAPAVTNAATNGTISVPVSSVRSPAHLVVVVSLEPQTLRRARQTIRLHVQVADTRGYLVRGARVALRVVPSGKLTAAAQQTSASDGRAGFSLRLKDPRMRNGSLSLIVSAADPAAPSLALASRLVRLSVRIPGSR